MFFAAETVSERKRKHKFGEVSQLHRMSIPAALTTSRCADVANSAATIAAPITAYRTR